MNAHSSHFFDSTILGQTAVFRAPYSTPARTARKSKADPAPKLSASLWRHTANECEATRRHGLVVQSLCGLLGVLSLGSVVVAAWQMHALFSGNHLQQVVSAFLH